MRTEDRKKVKQVEAALDGKSKRWIEDYASHIGVTFDEMMKNTNQWLLHGDHWNEGPKFEFETLPNEFWEHYQKIAATDVPDDKQHSFFSCAC